MKDAKTMLVCFLVTWTAPGLAPGAELNTIMMEATCKVIGPNTLATGFVIGKTDQNKPPKVFHTLITAHHVLQATRGDTVNLVFRQKQQDGSWKRIEISVKIRDNQKPLWQKHPEVDLAAIFIQLPKNVINSLVTTDLLIGDQKLLEYEIHPGAELLCLGYPFGMEANPQGFPILRSGRIASYPLTPTKKIKTFLFDFAVFKGNSGGPVYFVEHNPIYGRTAHMGRTIRGIIGIVVRERSITQKIQELYEKSEKVTPLQLGEVIHASFIKELVDSMKVANK